MSRCIWAYLFSAACVVPSASAAPNETLGALHQYDAVGRTVELVTAERQRIRLTAYGDHIVRVQVVRLGAKFPASDPYPMVKRHDWSGELRVREADGELIAETPAANGVEVRVARKPLRLRWSIKGNPPFLREKSPPAWRKPADQIPEHFEARLAFEYERDEHFAGLGHPAFGRLERLDRSGATHATEHGNQAPLVVPFYLSSRGYGLFLNTTWRPVFDFAGKYELTAATPTESGHLDYFVIAGPTPREVIDRYTRLTGRPRLPPLPMFGLSLSDKGAKDDFEPTPEGWAKKVAAHRGAGYGLDHLVFDNRWHTGGGTRTQSRFEWEPKRFPDPARFATWCRENGLVVTLDLNRINSQLSPGWDKRFNLAAKGWVDETPDFDERPRRAKELGYDVSLPDLSRKEVTDWMWGMFRDRNYDPRLKYPSPGLWLDEFDAYGADPGVRIGNGRTWDEMKGTWFLLLAKAMVENWERDVAAQRRPFVWIRGGSAGMQRYATLWSGDIFFGDAEMKLQVRGMLSAGLSGFPYWGHDAGGFRPFPLGPKDLDDERYVRWSLAMGAFSPYWKPHGHMTSRWPADRPALPASARMWVELRYRLMPYTYSLAIEAQETGVPIARAMLLDHSDEPEAWNRDLQYLWGPNLLVAPSYSPKADDVDVWLPKGNWHRFLHPHEPAIAGGRSVRVELRGLELLLLAPSGALIPMAEPALSTAAIDRTRMEIHVFSGADGKFTLREDDGETERYRRGERRTTSMSYAEVDRKLTVGPAEGSYAGAPERRSYAVIVHGLKETPESNSPLDLGTRSRDQDAIEATVPPRPIWHSETSDDAI